MDIPRFSALDGGVGASYPVSSAERSSTNNPVRVLVIEDNPINQLYLRAVLERSGFYVDLAEGVNAALELAHKTMPDISLLDVMLPDGDGFSLCERFKADPLLASMPIIFLSAVDDGGARVKGLSIGAVDYITKPFNAEEVIARVRIHVKLARASRELQNSQAARLASLRHAQQVFLTDVESIPEARCSVYYEASQEAGGDQYDAIRLGSETFCYYVADIAGHGIETVFQSSALKALFRENASVLNTPEETLLLTSEGLGHYLDEGQHVTAAYLIVSRLSGRAYYASAGHLPSLLVHQDGRLERLTAEGDVLGVFSAPHFKSVTLNLSKGSRIWLCSDGVIEDFENRRSWRKGLDVFAESVLRVGGLPRREALARLTDELFKVHPGGDDRLIMAVDV